MPTWYLDCSTASGTNMAASGNNDSGNMYGLGCWPQTSPWPPAISGLLTILTALSRSIDHRSQYGLSWMYRPLTSTSPPLPAVGSKGQGHHVGFRQCHRLHPLGSQASSGPGAAAWTTDTNMASWWHQRPQSSFEKIQSGDELFLVLHLHSCPEP